MQSMITCIMFLLYPNVTYRINFGNFKKLKLSNDEK